MKHSVDGALKIIQINLAAMTVYDKKFTENFFVNKKASRLNIFI